MTKHQQRRVTFNTHCEVREFETFNGGFYNSSRKTVPKLSTIHPVGMPIKLAQKKVMKRSIGTSQLPRFTPKSPKTSKFMMPSHLRSPMNRNMVSLFNLNNDTDFHVGKLFGNRKKNQGVIWTQPKALKIVRGYWHHSDELESSGENPADTETNTGSPDDVRKKKLMTRNQRFHRHIATKDKRDARVRRTLEIMMCEENVENHVAKAEDSLEERAKAGRIVSVK
ncbi:unnamed protein product [Caenorhabditis sp. 36 PRJEB53466]|nr:unnamed protein product [Caenorhabditis sp. 36 PRJEB53466]